MRFFLRPLTSLSVLLLFTAATADDSSWQFLPAIGHTTETGWMIGALPIWYPAQQDEASLPSHVEFAAYLSTEGQYKIEAKPKLTLWEGKARLTSNNALLFWPSNFFGRGAHTPNTPIHYDARIFSSQSDLLRQMGNNLWLGPLLTIRLQSLQWEKGVPPPDEPGAEESREFGLGLKVSRESRDNRNAATHGFLLSGEAEAFPSWIGNSDPYARTKIDLRGYTSLLWDWVAAVTLVAEQQYGTPPLNALLTPDGKAHLRGFRAGRYRDQSLITLGAELRAPLFWRIGATFFAETGRVGEHWGEIASKSDGWVQVVGVGGRLALHKEQKLNARGDLSLVNEPGHHYFALTIQVGEAF